MCFYVSPIRFIIQVNWVLSESVFFMLWQLGFTMWCQLVFGLMKYVPTNVFFRVLSIIFTIRGQLSTWVNETHFTPSEFHYVILTKFILWSIQLFFLCDSFFFKKRMCQVGFVSFITWISQWATIGFTIVNTIFCVLSIGFHIVRLTKYLIH